MINLLPGIDGSAAALQAERMRMAVASQNIANANVSKGIDGKPYQRQQVVFEAVLAEQGDLPGDAQMVKVARIEKDTRPPRLVFNPGHPDADASGMVALPNVNIHEEMADMITSSRAYEANLAVIRNAREIATQTLNLGQ